MAFEEVASSISWYLRYTYNCQNAERESWNYGLWCCGLKIEAILHPIQKYQYVQIMWIIFELGREYWTIIRRWRKSGQKRSPSYVMSSLSGKLICAVWVMPGMHGNHTLHTISCEIGSPPGIAAGVQLVWFSQFHFRALNCFFSSIARMPPLE